MQVQARKKTVGNTHRKEETIDHRFFASPQFSFRKVVPGTLTACQSCQSLARGTPSSGDLEAVREFAKT